MEQPNTNSYNKIVEHYINCFQKFGDTPKGLDWPNLEDLMKRYDVITDVVRSDEPFSILDFGCGTARLFPFLEEKFIQDFKYLGLDMGQEYVTHSKEKFPDLEFICGDVLADNSLMPEVDYVVMNGVFTEKQSLSFEEMWSYTKQLLAVVFEKANKGISFNVMSKNVDWERDDLFHLGLDELSKYLCDHLSRNFVIRNDYGLYEYTVFLYK